MSRVKWASAMRKATGGSAVHSQAGRLHADAVSPQKIGWAVCGGSAFVRQAVPAMRKAGMNVAALSVTPESGNFHSVMDKLKAQDAADRVASQLQVDLSLSVDVLASARSFEHVLLEEPLPASALDDLQASSKRLFWAADGNGGVGIDLAEMFANVHVQQAAQA